MNEDQQRAFEKVKQGNNVIITGGAGTGKSYLLGHIAENCQGPSALTAMTGAAAVLINGSTLHSALSIGLAKDTAEKIAAKISLNRRWTKYYEIKSLEVLMIDEVSMLNDELFEKVSKILQIIRENHKPFGGLQVILVGDLYQLPPVEGKYCFQSDHWKECNFEICELTQNMRQKDDQPFIEMLSRLRLGRCSRADLETLKALKNTQFPEGIQPTRLYCKNVDVDCINNTELAKLKQELTIYSARFSGIVEDSKRYAKSSNVPDHVSLCVGAQVMVTYNIDNVRQIVNGTRGVVVSLNQTSVTLRLMDGRIEQINFLRYQNEDMPDIDFTYLPIKLAWAVTIHKSQGMTLDAIEIDIGENIFIVGQAYTALSRARNLKSVRVLDVAARSFCTSKDVIDFVQSDKSTEC